MKSKYTHKWGIIFEGVSKDKINNYFPLRNDMYSDGDIIIIIIIIGVFGSRFKLVLLVLHWLRWYFVGNVGISLVALVIR